MNPALAEVGVRRTQALTRVLALLRLRDLEASFPQHDWNYGDLSRGTKHSSSWVLLLVVEHLGRSPLGAGPRSRFSPNT